GIRDWSVTGVQTCALPICTPVAGHLDAVAVGDSGYFHPLRNAAGATVIRLNNVGSAAGDEVGKGVFRIQVLACGDADIQLRSKQGIAFHFLRRGRLLVPEANPLLVDATAAE